MSFFIYDLVFLIVFTLFVIIFLYSRRTNLKREGLLYLYRTKWGIKLINYIGRKYQKTLYFLSYISITLGYILMVAMLYLLGKIVYIYLLFPQIVRTIKIPPIMPLIPYLPKVFKLDFLPPFYFTYFIISLAIIAITHEFAHGIFARSFNIKIKATGFGFLGPFLAAFVELDEEKMEKEPKFRQLAILSSGTFANTLTAIFFFGFLICFFLFAFSPAGIVFDTYSYSVVNLNEISSINNLPVINPTYEKIFNSLDETNQSIIKIENRNYLATRNFLEQQKPNKAYIILYDDAPAINSKLRGIITEINGVKIVDKEILAQELEKYSEGEKVKITTKLGGESTEYEIVLDEHPKNKGVSWLGIGFYDKKGTGIMGNFYSLLSFFKEDHVYYEPESDFSVFIYDLLWWIILISFSVALINMLPVGIFDGGRVFYLSVLFLTKNERTSKKIFSWMTYLFLFLLLLLIILWVFSFR